MSRSAPRPWNREATPIVNTDLPASFERDADARSPNFVLPLGSVCVYWTGSRDHSDEAGDENRRK